MLALWQLSVCPPTANGLTLPAALYFDEVCLFEVADLKVTRIRAAERFPDRMRQMNVGWFNDNWNLASPRFALSGGAGVRGRTNLLFSGQTLAAGRLELPVMDSISQSVDRPRSASNE